MSKTEVIVILFSSVNVFAYLLMCIDKWQSKRPGNRIPERTLLLIAFCFGALGIYLGMLPPVRHKSTKPLFKIVIPLCLLLNVLLGYFMEKFISVISI